MAMIDKSAGCKVGWETFDSEAEAHARSATAVEEARSRAARGYDFGYLVPGTINTSERDGKRVWVVTVP